jgi:hypothetical protein
MKFSRLFFLCLFLLLICAAGTTKEDRIDRKALVARNMPVVQRFSPLSSLSIGNSHFAFTVDATELQTFPEIYSEGVPLWAHNLIGDGTVSQTKKGINLKKR